MSFAGRPFLKSPSPNRPGMTVAGCGNGEGSCGRGNSSAGVTGAMATGPAFVSSPVSLRRSQIGAMRASSQVLTLGGPSDVDPSYNGNAKTTGSPKIFSGVHRRGKSHSQGTASVAFDGPANQKPPGDRNWRNHTDPFSPLRTRDDGKKKNLLHPEGNQPEKAVGIKTSMQKGEEGKVGHWHGHGKKTHSGGAHQKVGRIFDNNKENGTDGTSPSPTGRPSASMSPKRGEGCRFRLTDRGQATILQNKPDTHESQRISKIMTKPVASMVGVLTPEPARPGPANYKFNTPFGRQNSVAASVKLPSRCHPSGRFASRPKGQHLKTPFARNDSKAVSQHHAAPVRTSMKTFHAANAGPLRTPFARHNSVAVNHVHKAKRNFVQRPTTIM